MKGCAEILRDGVVVGHICGGGGIIERPLRWRPTRYWCFKCRKRHVHRAYLFNPGAYYDYEHVWKCDGCGEDHREFPG